MKGFIVFVLFLTIITILDFLFPIGKYWFTKPIYRYLHLYDDGSWEGPTAVAMVVFLVLFLVFITVAK